MRRVKWLKRNGELCNAVHIAVGTKVVCGCTDAPHDDTKFVSWDWTGENGLCYGCKKYQDKAERGTCGVPVFYIMDAAQPWIEYDFLLTVGRDDGKAKFKDGWNPAKRTWLYYTQAAEELARSTRDYAEISSRSEVRRSAFVRQYVAVFLAGMTAREYSERCSGLRGGWRGYKPPVEDAEFLAKEALKALDDLKPDFFA